MALRKKRDEIYNEPIRAGNRGGQGLFRWDAVKGQKDDEHYLGSTIKAGIVS
jgi:Multiple myeloma tumor-associated